MCHEVILTINSVLFFVNEISTRFEGSTYIKKTKVTWMAKSPERQFNRLCTYNILLNLSWLVIARGKVIFSLKQIWCFQPGFPWLM